jgi:hypothetical protein
MDVGLCSRLLQFGIEWNAAQGTGVSKNGTLKLSVSKHSAYIVSVTSVGYIETLELA